MHIEIDVDNGLYHIRLIQNREANQGYFKIATSETQLIKELKGYLKELVKHD